MSLSLLAATGCDFFKELEGNESETGESSTESSTGDESGDTGESGDGPCIPGQDDFCSAQDLLEACDPDSGELVTFDCAAACSPNLNVSCLQVGTVQSCWCAAPGNNKIDSCSELEDCLDSCGANAYAGCGDACFGRTDASTIRLFGSLLHCAEESCAVICDADAVACTNCLYDARAGLIGDCALERSICDMDSNGDTWP